MASRKSLTLCWNGTLLGRITEFEVHDWPWVRGRLEAGDWPADLRAAIEWLAEQAETEDGPGDPPFSIDFFEGWSVVDQKGEAKEISVPIVDFKDGSIEWR